MTFVWLPDPHETLFQLRRPHETESQLRWARFELRLRLVRVGPPHETLFQLKFNDNGNPARIDSPLFGIGLRLGGVYPLHPFLRGGWLGVPPPARVTSVPEFSRHQRRCPRKTTHGLSQIYHIVISYPIYN